MQDTQTTPDSVTGQPAPASEKPVEGQPVPPETASSDADASRSLIGDALDEQKNKSTAQSAANYDGILKEFNLDSEESKAISELLGKHSLSEDAAKDMLAYQKSAIEKAIQLGKDAQISEINSSFKSAQQKLIAESEKRFGDKLNEAIQFSTNAVNRVLDRENADKFTAFLKSTGLGNDPLFIEFASRIGKVFSEDSASNGSTLPRQPLYEGSGLTPG